MRFAGQRFRTQRFVEPDARAPRASAESGRSPYNGGVNMPSAMTNMRDINASSYTFTGMPSMADSPFTLGNFQEPDFAPPSRV